MEASVSVRVFFDAAHQLSLEQRERCSRSHGHRWSAEAEKSGPEDGFERDVREAVAEWSDRSVNEMLHGGDPSPEGMARALMERLLLRHPKTARVSVSDGTVTGIVRNTPR